MIDLAMIPWWPLWRASFQSPSRFLLELLIKLPTPLTGLLLLSALSSHTHGISSWTPAEVMFCWGFSEAAVAIYNMLAAGVSRIPSDYGRTGDLDRILLRPVAPLSLILLEHFAPAELSIVMVAIGMMGLGAREMHVWSWGLLPLQLLAASGVLFSIQLCLATLGLLLGTGRGGADLLLRLSLGARMPPDALPGGVRFLLATVLPLGFSGFYAAVLFTGREEWRILSLSTLPLSLIFTTLSYRFWCWGVQRHTS